ncbi:MAG TPA: CHAT domain-containing protein [Cyanobacteria bacterium UBA11149]|nr:CHAT domain-containing protein [Cyanobacteria bacterium UBA11366]HBK62680.1 CHAT domain-containing protein [Cyanobacteria bacterium UBA11166]HBR73210.1 CHAT domain-containing protein [Cyanobacteria bacterium UBA11159]HBS71634.1 CHAT domain-containing protein [Cyanobacteria bacterium UBA11153]HBW90810.1 CHAT domain-containing protein [Cyanobacteria bacterium UBA11149]HCA97719.1 CHAT domain-containing protein [Cyanobacteria bacterium UBA9226]
MAQELQEFHISVTPLGDDQYLVRTEKVAPGVPLAEEQVFWPVEDWLSMARQLMNDPLLGLFSGNGNGIEDIFFLPDSQKRVNQSCLNLVSLGQEMYNALFQGGLRDSWLVAQAIAQNQRQMLRLRLGLKGNRLPRLPWEVLHEDSRPLATGTDVAFCRYQINTGLMRTIPNTIASPNKPLRILMVIAGPSDRENLELFKEASHLREELKSGDIQLTVREHLGREELTQELEQGQYQVFHYAGHSSLGDSGGDVYLVSSKTGLTETLNGDDLAGLLVNNGVQLAVFNSCRSAYTATSDSSDSGKDRNLAEALVKRGIPGVLAMAERIPDEVALTLTCLLYRNINQGHPIDLSLSRARQGLISAYGSNQLYWALPVLYLTPEFDGYLIDVAGYHWDDEQPLPEFNSPWRSPQIKEELSSPPRLQQSNWLKDELGNDPMSIFTSYDDLDAGIDNSSLGDLDSEDPADFIKNLLGELDKELPNSSSPLPVLEGENYRNTGLESGVSQAPSHRSNNQTSPPQKSTSTSPPQTSPGKLLVSSPPAQKNWWQNIPKLWLGLGIGSVIVAILGIGLIFRSQSPSNPPDVANPGIESPHNSPNVSLPEADTSTVTNIAIEQLSRGNITEGQKAVEELLNRGNLPQAKAALDAIPKTLLDKPNVSFLRGRLAWQFIQQGSKDYNIDDARRYWEIAVKGEAKSAEYQNALGFAYYAEGDLDRANNAWLDALSLIEKSQIEADVAGVGAKRDVLNAYAGLALGFWKSSQKQPEPKRANLLNESLKLRQKVRTDDPVNFQPQALSKNWLWSEAAIRDWSQLLAVKK